MAPSPRIFGSLGRSKSQQLVTNSRRIAVSSLPIPLLPLLSPPNQPSPDLRLRPGLLRLVVHAPGELLGQIMIVHTLRLVRVGVAVAGAVALALHQTRHGVAQVHRDLRRVLLAHIVKGAPYGGIGGVGFRS